MFRCVSRVRAVMAQLCRATSVMRNGEQKMTILPRRIFNCAILAAALLVAGGFSTAWAGTAVPFSAAAFKAAQAAGNPILVEIHADWCPTCKAQVPILDKL